MPAPVQGCKSWLIRKAIAAKIAGLSEGKCGSSPRTRCPSSLSSVHAY